MAAHYIAFVVRLLVDDGGRMMLGRLLTVPDQEAHYFRTWEELIVLLEEHIRRQQDGEASQS